jgi:NADH:ubiquinone oxidoreductase subunit K
MKNNILAQLQNLGINWVQQGGIELSRLESLKWHQFLLFILLGLFLFTLLFTISSSRLNKNALKMLFIIELLTLILSLMILIITNYYNSIDGQILVLFLLTISALEASIGLAFIYLYFRLWRTTALLKINKFRE